MQLRRDVYIGLILGVFLHTSAVVHAGELRDKADAAVAGILFEYDGVSAYASYRINRAGFVDITFPKNMPEPLYGEVVTRLQNHPDIDGVLAGKGGPRCGLW